MKEFEENIMVEVRKEFMIGRTAEGLNIETSPEGITLDQINFIEKGSRWQN